MLVIASAGTVFHKFGSWLLFSKSTVCEAVTCAVQRLPVLATQLGRASRLSGHEELGDGCVIRRGGWVLAGSIVRVVNTCNCQLTHAHVRSNGLVPAN